MPDRMRQVAQLRSAHMQQEGPQGIMWPMPGSVVRRGKFKFRKYGKLTLVQLICHCGRTVIYPPVACGMTMNCPYPCAREPLLCGHPRTAHPCHEQPICPPCPFLTTKPCACGKDLAVKNIRCSQEKVSCGQSCGELLACGYHRCEKKCHRPGECGDCTQVCGKPKKICRHPCNAACHAPAKCPENDSCQAIITQSCSCGHLRSRTSCGASHSNPSSREAVVLKCNSECAVRQRNARLADALGIQPKERATEDWAPELRAFAAANNGFVRMVEGTFADFFKGTRQTMVLPHSAFLSLFSLIQNP